MNENETVMDTPNDWPTGDDLGDVSVSSVGDDEGANLMDEHQESAEVEEDNSEAESTKQPGPVPYSRFKQVNEKNKMLEQKVMQLEHDQSEMLAFVKDFLAGKQNKQEPEFEEPEYVDPMEQQLKELKAELAELKGHREKEVTSAKVARLQSEIESALNKYEHASPHEILLVLRQNPNLSVDQIAKRSHDTQLSKIDAYMRKNNPRQPKQTLQSSGLTATKKMPATWDDLTADVLSEL